MSSSLETLEIESACLKDVEVMAMARGIDSNPISSLRELCLTNMRKNVSVEVLEGLGEMLLTNKTLTKLMFAAPLGDSKMLLPIVEALEVNRTLRVLCTDHYMGFLDSAVQDTAALSRLNGDAQPLQDEDVVDEENEHVNNGDDNERVEEEDEDEEEDDDATMEHGPSQVELAMIDMLKYTDVLEQLRSDVECSTTMCFYLNLNAAGRRFLLANPMLHVSWLRTIIRFRNKASVSFFLLSRNPDLIARL